MVKRYLPIPHDFVCFTDKPVEGIQCRKPPSVLPGWWGKIGLFKPLDVVYPLLYLDLDVVVTGELDVLFGGQDFATIRQWKLIRSPKTVPGYNSSAMLFGYANCRGQIWSNFDPSVMRRFRGDQDWLRHCCPDEKMWSDNWFVAMEHCSYGPPKDCRLVLCNVIDNYVAAARFDWAREAWL